MTPGEIAARLEWINARWNEIPAGAEFPVYRAPAVPLKKHIRDNAEELKTQPIMLAAVVEAVERATGRTFGQEG